MENVGIVVDTLTGDVVRLEKTASDVVTDPFGPDHKCRARRMTRRTYDREIRVLCKCGEQIATIEQQWQLDAVVSVIRGDGNVAKIEVVR